MTKEKPQAPKIEQWEVEKIKPYARNTKKHPPEQIQKIAASLHAFGFNQPIVVDSAGVIIAGHGRLLGAKELGLKKVPVVVANWLSEEEVMAYRIADNKLNESDWDKDFLKFEMLTLNRSEFDLKLTGFDAEEILGFLQDELPENEGKTDKDDIPDNAERRTKLGEVWSLGIHRLMIGDSTNEEDVDKLMKGELCDLIITDPPYNVAYEGGTDEKMTIQNDSMSDGDFREFLLKAFKCMKKSSKPGAGIYVFHADSEGYNFRGAMRDAGFKIAQCCIWVKNSLVMGRQDYQWQHEPCLYGWNPDGSHHWHSDRKQTTVWNFDKPRKNDIHPTMKPVNLIEYPMKNSSSNGQLVLDLFGGSGSTLIAAETTGRRCNLMELDPKYADRIIARWEQFTGQIAAKVHGK